MSLKHDRATGSHFGGNGIRHDIGHDRFDEANVSPPPNKRCAYDCRPPNSKFPTWRRAQYRHLPYGVWVTKDGTEVLFDRDYCPLHRRAPGAPVVAMAGTEWIEDIVVERWFYNGHNEPWNDPATYQRCMRALKDFGVSST